jgi:hypothetical protein
MRRSEEKRKKVTMFKLELMVVRCPRLAILTATPSPSLTRKVEGGLDGVTRAKMQTAKGKVLGN